MRLPTFKKIVLIGLAVIGVGLIPNEAVLAEAEGQTSAGVGGPENIVVDIDTNMIPVYWDGNPSGDAAGKWKTVDPANLDNRWYDYTKKYWANAVTVEYNALSTYQNTTDKVVDEADIMGYWVYVPRYRYQIQRYSGIGHQPIEKPTAFHIKFENQSTAGYQKAIPEQNGDWATHPAFSFGDDDNPNPTELNGLWIGKFEMTGTANQPTVKPNLPSLRNRGIGAQFTASLNMSTNPDGAAGGNFIIPKGGGNNVHNLSGQTQSHVAKNSDWGAAVYLATSSYGRNSVETWSNSNTQATTGCSGDSVSAAASSTCHQYYTSEGVHASTTDNIYGAYDMSGGLSEYVMGNYGDTADSHFITIVPQTRYLNVYYVGPFGIKPSQSLSSAEYYYNFDICNFELCGGQANHETTRFQSVSLNNQAWFSDSSEFPEKSYMWTRRGGYYIDTVYAGLFSSHMAIGGSDDHTSFRTVLSRF